MLNFLENFLYKEVKHSEIEEIEEITKNDISFNLSIDDEVIMDSFSNAVILNHAFNKEDIPFTVTLIEEKSVYRNEKTYTIYLFNKKTNPLRRASRLEFGVVSSEEGVHIVVYDVIVLGGKNIGTGSLAMEQLIKFAKEINARFIIGALIPSNEEDDLIRNNFYKKFEFEILTNNLGRQKCYLDLKKITNK